MGMTFLYFFLFIYSRPGAEEIHNSEIPTRTHLKTLIKAKGPGKGQPSKTKF